MHYIRRQAPVMLKYARFLQKGVQKPPQIVLRHIYWSLDVNQMT